MGDRHLNHASLPIHGIKLLVQNCFDGHVCNGVYNFVFAQQLFRECKISLHKSSTDETGNAVDRYMHSGNEQYIFLNYTINQVVENAYGC